VRDKAPVQDTVVIIGAGLAGCEAALQLADRGIPVELFGR
jgi:folate-dependent tRNA-U54 methylase TrmFO/GidA